MLVFVLYLGEIFLYKRSNRHESCQTVSHRHHHPKGERAIVDGHPWVYEGEVVSVSGTPEDGSLVDVVSKKGSWLGCGFYNSASKIRVRLVTRNANDDPAGDAFWERRLRYAWDYRKTVIGETDSRCCRIIFGEADGFPGLTVDRFERVLVAQVLSLGMERIKERVLPLLVRILREDGQVIRGVYERNDAALRTLEGMAQGKGWLVLPGEAAPEGTAEDITENGIRYTVDFENGQKTGFFLDQKYNRLAVAKLAKGQDGAGLLHPHRLLRPERRKGRGEARDRRGRVAVRRGLRGGEPRKNGLDGVMDCVCANVFDLLPQLAEQPRKYDFIILDPPALHQEPQDHTQRHDRVQGDQLPGHEAAAQGGYLATCSCSHFASEALFIKMLRDAARDAGVQLRQIEARQQCADHPILWGVEETNYLKFLYFSGGVTGFCCHRGKRVVFCLLWYVSEEEGAPWDVYRISGCFCWTWTGPSIWTTGCSTG